MCLTWVANRARFTMFLGLTLDEHLSWKYHIDAVRLSVCKSLYILNTVKHIFNAKMLRMLYFALVHPHINYGLLLWGFLPSCYFNVIVKMQKRAVRMIGNARYNSPTGELFKKYTIPKVETLRSINLLIFMHEVIYNSAPSSILNIFTKKQNVHGYNTRQGDLHVEQRNLSLSTNSFLHKGPLAWLNLEGNLKNCASSLLFKKRSNFYYYMNDF